ncbi:RimK family alpha-L-glutamate ligase [Streptomyces sp. NPDC060194]|uniref:ATP-grasp domain-containing protein n=1 Tax=Streptomyces sp. NPDC060194 TaxID=3347069 RepID=UPI003654FE16
MPRIALVTCRPGPDVSVDRDLPLLVRELAKGGAAEAVVAYWDDPAVDWAGFDLAVLRSTWDYSWRRDEFLDWAVRCAAVTRLANPLPVVRWNSDKRYLGDLARAGVPTVPTAYRAPGDAPDLPEGDFVVKPTSGAGARYAARYRAAEHAPALRQLERMHAEGLTAMVQPYVTGIDTSGERALVFFGGRFLHAIRKGAVLTAGVPFDARKNAHPSPEPWQPTEAEQAVAERALAVVPGGPGHLLYARVDLVDGDDGQPRVMELELVEPNLFLTAAHPGSAPLIAEAVLTAAAAG